MTGSLSVHGIVLPVGGVTAKIEAAAKIGLKTVLIPRANLNDVLLEEEYRDKIQVVPCDTLYDVVEHALVDCPKKDDLMRKLEALEMRLPKHPPAIAAKAPAFLPLGSGTGPASV